MSLLQKMKNDGAKQSSAHSSHVASSIASTGAGPAKKGGFRVDFGPSKKDILNFSNQLAVMIRAGISLQDSLESIGSQIQKVKFRSVVLDLKARIEAGQSFSQALAEHPDVTLEVEEFPDA